MLGLVWVNVIVEDFQDFLTFSTNKGLHHLFNSHFIIISIRKKLNVVCLNLSNITQPQLCLKRGGGGDMYHE